MRLARRCIPLLVFVSLTLTAYAHLAFSDHILARGDTFAYFYPYWEARNEALRQGQLPLWTNDVFMGAPLLANSQLGTFYPPNWLVVGLSAPDGVKISILIHIVWAGIGAYGLARRVLRVGRLSALAAGVIFAFGGYIGAHVEQINQLQGISWIPWAFWALSALQPKKLTPHASGSPFLRQERGLGGAVLLSLIIALQFLSGHTQTVFITLIGLGLYALMQRGARRRSIIGVIVAGMIALILVVPQLIPTLELSILSNRGGGLSQNEATAFSLPPYLIGRGLLPSYDTSIFTEYIAYIGVFGLGLALVGVFMRSPVKTGDADMTPRGLGRAVKWSWLVLAIVSVIFALGVFTPVYWELTRLPGFNLFRVPARWLALFALSMAMLASLGFESLMRGLRVPPRALIVFVGIVIVQIALALITPSTITGAAIPEPTRLTLVIWIGTAVAFAAMMIGHEWLIARQKRAGQASPLQVRLRQIAPYTMVALLAVELVAANRALPHTETVPPDVWSAERFTVSQLQAYQQDQGVPGRVLSISNTYFDPGDAAVLTARYRAAGMTDVQIRHALNAIKLQEVVAPNLSLAWGIPSIDGYDGGVLPSEWYTQFSSLLLPENAPRTVDGRLRELLAREDCFGACIPDQRWLNLIGVEYLVLDKVFDLWYEGVAYDTGLPQVLSDNTSATYANPQAFVADAVDIAYVSAVGAGAGLDLPVIVGAALIASENTPPIEIGILAATPVLRARYRLDEIAAPETITVRGDSEITVMAVTLVDTRTGDFQQLAPTPWTRVLSSDIKIYRNADVLPRAFVSYQWALFENDYDGTEAALTWMRQTDLASAVALNQNYLGSELLNSTAPPAQTASVVITEAIPERFTVNVSDLTQSAFLVISEPYYPGWMATVNGQPAPIYRANVMFRAVLIPAGDSEVVIEYRPFWLLPSLIIGGGAWIIVLGWLVIHGLRRRFA